LIVTSTPQGWFVYWKGMQPTKLLDESCLVAYNPDLPFQAGKPLSPIGKEGAGDTKLVDYNTTYESSPDRHVYLAIVGDLGEGEECYANELAEHISADEPSANAPQNESPVDQIARRERNRHLQTKCSRSRAGAATN
jgi:hypothetical protein